ncbi:chemotaxis protein CheW [Desulfomonile tiedjei]|uniref:Chemotaxis signal transduction protein n=1 Tax=Desulfomonile tiedjei (strain ATCC 49306 / DSM 6799 / DCB-1) TaxID=706587 RepID=I4BZP8_DESTA|nr:chemotaxis protein CheW [Desulfomonile tiedjei]AFM22789.1 chemotaxis signal transduction protein [Desulfomonile tiedjei DSM 6799]
MTTPENLQSSAAETADGQSSASYGPAGQSADSSLQAMQSRTLTPAEKKRILKERARKLAQRAETQEKEEESLQIIEFMLAHERYGVDVEYVKEVYPLKDLTAIPCTPSFVLGIINVRGQVFSVVDIRDFFDLPKHEITASFRIIIVKNENMEFGILADSVIGEQKIPLNKIQVDMPSLKGIRSHYVKGVTSERLIIMDVEKLLSDESIIVHEEVGSS